MLFDYADAIIAAAARDAFFLPLLREHMPCCYYIHMMPFIMIRYAFLFCRHLFIDIAVFYAIAHGVTLRYASAAIADAAMLRLLRLILLLRRLRRHFA